MNTKLILIFILLILCLLLFVYLRNNSKEDFSEQKYTSQNLIDMFNSLEVAEKRCEELEERRNIKNEKEKIKVNEATFNELEELDKKIIELKEILKDLTIDKKRKDNIVNQCRKNKQVKLNQNYDLLKKLNKNGLVKNNEVNLDLNISDSINFNLNKKNNTNNRCSVKNPKKYVNIDKNKIVDKCYNCNTDKLKPNYAYIHKDFE